MSPDLVSVVSFILEKGFPAAVLVAVVITYQRQQTQSDSMFAYLQKQVEEYRALLEECLDRNSRP